MTPEFQRTKEKLIQLRLSIMAQQLYTVIQQAKEKNITEVVFDRGGFRYHGRVKALAETAREKGLHF